MWLPWILVPDSAPEKNPGVPLTANGFDGIFKVSPVSDRHGRGNSWTGGAFPWWPFGCWNSTPVELAGGGFRIGESLEDL